MLVLIGLPVLIVGVALRINLLLVAALAALATGLAAGLDLVATIAALGKGFNAARTVTAIWVVVPVVALLERFGLQERAREWVAARRGLTTGRLLLAYLVVRQLTAALGLVAIAGQAQTVRPLLAPMAEGAAGDRPPADRERLRAWAAATDNVGVFFGEDIFLAIASILLIKSFLEANGIVLMPLQLSIWALPTAAAALLVHGSRLLALDRRLARGGRP